MSDTILLSVEDGLARLTFHRPASLNAMDFEMAARWRDLARELTADTSVRAIVLDAAGPAFCAGGDVREMATSGATGADVTAAAGVIHDGIRALVESETPVVAAVQGAVAGGGLGLMLTADYVVASERATFASKYANIGLSPDLGVSTLLPAAIGQRRALQLLLRDTTIDAATALDWGLVAEVVEPHAVAARAEQIARSWLDGAAAAYGRAKRLVRAGTERSFADRLDDEARSIGMLFETEEARARVAAFVTRARS